MIKIEPRPDLSAPNAPVVFVRADKDTSDAELLDAIERLHTAGKTFREVESEKRGYLQ